MKINLNKRILSALLALVLFVTSCPVVTSASNDFAITCEGEAVSRVEFPMNKKLEVSAENLPAGYSYQWQIQVPDTDLWVDIQGQEAQTLNLSYALLGSLLDRRDSAYIRCAAVGGEEEICTDSLRAFVLEPAEEETAPTEEMTVPVVTQAPIYATEETVPETSEAEEETVPEISEAEEEIVPETSEAEEEPVPETTEAVQDTTASEATEAVEETVAPVEPEPTEEADQAAKNTQTKLRSVTRAADTGTENTVYHTIKIIYQGAPGTNFEGQRVALPHIEEVPHNGKPQIQVIDSPGFVGYTPVPASIPLGDEITQDHEYIVYYYPAEVAYTVRHYQQNIDNDEYTLVNTTMVKAFTESQTSNADAAIKYEGFEALSHITETVAADSSTMIDIYYDRNYYLMSFDLDGGYGVEAIYARYGASITVDTPTKSGYSFEGWLLDGQKVTLPSTMPYIASGEIKYAAKWEPVPGGTTYTVAYWLENPDVAGKYDYIGAKEFSADAGDTVHGEDNAVADGIFSADEKKYYTLKEEPDSDDDAYVTQKNVIVSGDNSTVVNVYYDRNEYVLRFFYARSFTQGGTTYYQISHRNNAYDDEDENVSVCDWDDGQGKKYTTKPTLISKYKENECELDDNSTYTYYFFDLTVKYGQNITDIWPHTPITNATDATTFGKSFVSWGTQPGSGYYTKNDKPNGNKNIKGPYSIVTSDLLVDASVVAPNVNHNLIAYYGTPKMWTAYVYYSALAGETATKEYNGKKYVLHGEPIIYGAQIDSVDQLSQLEFPGVQFDTRVDGKNNNDEVDATSTQWYYSRSVHELTLDDNYGNTIPYEIPYGGLISNYIDELPTPNYPNELPADAYQFEGWYSGKNGTGEKLELNDTNIMPNGDQIYYAYWNPKVYTITITDGEGNTYSTQQTAYGGKASKPQNPQKEDAEFIGWYYKVGKVEYAFDFENMKIESDMEIYAKWRYNDTKNVTIEYVCEQEVDGQTVQVPIADPESVVLRVGQVRTFEAKIGSALYEDYRTGYFPNVGSHSITPKAEDNEDLTFQFVYKKYGQVPYQVRFLIQTDVDADGNPITRPAFKKDDNGKAVFVSKEEYEQTGFNEVDLNNNEYIEQHWDNDKVVVVELYLPDFEDLADEKWVLPPAYFPNSLKEHKIIVPDQDDPQNNIVANTITFIYTYEEPKDPDDGEGGSGSDEPQYKSRYLVQYFIENPNYDPNDSTSEQYLLSDWENKEGYSGDEVSASPISLLGYTYDYTTTKEKMEAYNQNRNLEGIADNTLAQDPNTMTGVLSQDHSLELNFYYSINSYAYQVLYLEYQEGSDTGRQLAAPKKTITDSNGNEVTLKAPYNTKVTETAIEISEYEVVLTDGCFQEDGAVKQSRYIEMEADEDVASVNTIKFFYRKKNADLIITKQVKLDAEEAEKEQITQTNKDMVNNQEFAFTVQAEKGFFASFFNYTIYESAEDTVVTTGKIQTADSMRLNPISIKSGQRIQIHDLPMGEYTVTEEYVTGFLASVNGEMMSSKTVTLDKADQNVQVDFLNSYPFFTGDLVIMKKLADGSKPNRTYQVKIVLEPADEARERDRKITWTNGDGQVEDQTIPALTTDATKQFEIIVDVPAGGEVKLEGVPAGKFTATEIPNTGTNSITDFYDVTHTIAVHKNDEKTESGETVSSVIHGGHPTAVTFNNTSKTGSLKIQKTVTQEYENDNWTEDTFTFTIKGTTELPDGSYDVAVNGGQQAVTVTNGELTLISSIPLTKTDNAKEWTKDLTVTGLPAGYYTVTETAGLGNDKYTTEGPTDSKLVNGAVATEFDFTNTYNRTTGNLQVSKEIRIVTEGSIIDTNQEFTFVVESKDKAMTGSYTCTVKTKNGTDNTNDDTVVENSATFLSVNDDKQLVFTLKHDQYILIEKLPVGEYLVKEEALIGYDSSFGDVINDPGKYSVDPATITTNETISLACENAYPVYYSNLIVKKSVVDAAGNSKLDTAPKDDVFTFEISISNYSEKVDLTKGITAKFYNNTDNLVDTEAIQLTDGKLSFTLKAGYSVNLNLPACDYTITETKMNSNVNSGVLTDHYSVAYTIGNTPGEANKTYSLKSGDTETVTFTNTYKQHYGNLTIYQAGKDQNTAIRADDSGIYEVFNSSNELVTKVMITGEQGSVTLEQIPVDTYTIREINHDWTWTYDAYNSTNGEAAITEIAVEVKAGENNEATFTQDHKTIIEWLRNEVAKSFPAQEDNA